MPITDPKKLIRAAGTIINNDLVLVETARPRICMNRSLIIGFTILEMAKLIMYKFYYEASVFHRHGQLHILGRNTRSACRHGRHDGGLVGHLELPAGTSAILEGK